MRRLAGNARHWFGMSRAMAKARRQGVVAGIYAEAQPTITYLTDCGVRKLVVRVGDQEQGAFAELVIPDAKEFLASVREGVHWVEHGDRP